MVNPVRSKAPQATAAPLVWTSNVVNPVRKFRNDFSSHPNNSFSYFFRFRLNDGVFSNGVKKIILAVLSLMLLQTSLFAMQPIKTNTSELAPNFTLYDLDNNIFSLSDFKGKPVVLFFWTTWCPYCRRELRQLNIIHTELLSNNIELLAINADEPVDRVQRFIGSYPFSYRILLDTDAKVTIAYGILGVPTYIIINKEGCIVFNNHYFPQKEYKDIILK